MRFRGPFDTWRLAIAVWSAVAILALLAVHPADAAVQPVTGRVLLRFGGTYSDASGTHTHLGADIEASHGADVRSPVSGTVAFAGLVPAPGATGQRVGCVTVVSGDERWSLLPVAPAVRAGEPVVAGDPVGSVSEGGDGSLVATHLHVGLRRAGQYADPVAMFEAAAGGLGASGGSEGSGEGADAAPPSEGEQRGAAPVAPGRSHDAVGSAPAPREHADSAVAQGLRSPGFAAPETSPRSAAPGVASAVPAAAGRSVAAGPLTKAVSAAGRTALHDPGRLPEPAAPDRHGYVRSLRWAALGIVGLVCAILALAAARALRRSARLADVSFAPARAGP